jgi:hypothetical protein
VIQDLIFTEGGMNSSQSGSSHVKRPRGETSYPKTKVPAGLSFKKSPVSAESSSRGRGSGCRGGGRGRDKTGAKANREYAVTGKEGEQVVPTSEDGEK